MSDLQLPSLSDMLLGISRGAAAGEERGMPARVVSFTEGPPARVNVQPLRQKPGVDGAPPTDYPVIPDVPVVYPCGGGFRFTWPLQEGDVVWLTFATRELAQWKAGGQAAAPASSRRGALSDAVALAGFVLNDTAPAVEIAVTAAGKLRIGSPAVELLGLLKQALTLVAAGTVPPGGGTLSNATAIGDLATQLGTLVDS